MPIFRAVMDESRDIVEQAGIHWISQEQVAKDWPEITAPLRGSLNTEAQSSTWQSLARHQGSVETEFLNGEIVRVAAKLGKKAPLNEKLIQISQEMAANHDTPGKYNTTELMEMLGLKSK
jgi:2-dehydropantoate 2-reductase